MTILIFEIVNFLLLDGDVLRRPTSYGVYIPQCFRFARVFSHVADYNTCNKFLTQKLRKQGYPYHKDCKTFSTFIRLDYCLKSIIIFLAPGTFGDRVPLRLGVIN